MSIQHRIRAVRDRAEARAAGAKRGPRPAEYQRASELPEVDHERAAARTRVHPAQLIVETAPPKADAPRAPRTPRKSKRRRKG